MALLSRVAEALYWFGRALERVDATTRLLTVTYHGRLQGQPVEIAGAANTWEALLLTLGIDEEFRERHGDALTEAKVVEFLTIDDDNPSSIRCAMRQARENARSVRDFLSSETWISVNRAYRDLQTWTPGAVQGDGLFNFCDSVLTAIQAVHGTAEATCLHDEGWAWYLAGSALERGDMATRIVDAKYHLLLDDSERVGTPEDRFQWAALLRSISGWEAYRRLHPEGIWPAEVAHFLLLEPRLPRSLLASVDLLGAALQTATADVPPDARNPVMRSVSLLQNRLRYETADGLIRGGLHEALEGYQTELEHLHTVTRETFFCSVTDAL